MAELTKRISRETSATVFEQSKTRNLIVSIEPAGKNGSVIGLRAKGSRLTYRIAVNSVYNQAIRHHMDKIERRTKALRKEGYPARKAASLARKELDAELRDNGGRRAHNFTDTGLGIREACVNCTATRERDGSGNWAYYNLPEGTTKTYCEEVK